MGRTVINLILVVLWLEPIARALALVPTRVTIPPNPSCGVQCRQLSPSPKPLWLGFWS